MTLCCPVWGATTQCRCSSGDLFLCVQDTSFSCNVHPDSIIISAGLGNVTAIDASLEEDNPYRKACQPREGSSTSLIKVLHNML